jgi:hypothetical protein
MARAGIRRKSFGGYALRRLDQSIIGSDGMDDSRTHACNDATAAVSRGFEPVRIERQLLARAFDLACEIDSHEIRSSQRDPTVEQRDSDNLERRRAA